VNPYADLDDWFGDRCGEGEDTAPRRAFNAIKSDANKEFLLAPGRQAVRAPQSAPALESHNSPRLAAAIPIRMGDRDGVSGVSGRLHDHHAARRRNAISCTGPSRRGPWMTG
jgi:hypothetical protein